MTLNKTDIPNIISPWGADVKPAIFVFAHQDDETLTFGAEIEYHKSAGRYVIGVLSTDGRSSSVKASTGLDDEDFVRARNLELINASIALGIDELHFTGAFDGSLNQNQADAIAIFWYQHYPTASFKVPSDKDDHPDHKALGIAFRKIKTSTPSADIRFYVKPEQWTSLGAVNTTPGGPATLAAIESYKLVDIPNGHYAIAYQSVPFDFDALEATPKSCWQF